MTTILTILFVAALVMALANVIESKLVRMIIAGISITVIVGAILALIGVDRLKDSVSVSFQTSLAESVAMKVNSALVLMASEQYEQAMVVLNDGKLHADHMLKIFQYKSGNMK